jgi:3-carboxy-cis,cis-muconate cycloisomerase
MRENLNATHGLPMAEHVTAMLAPAIGRLEAHQLVAWAAERATANGISLAEAVFLDEKTAAQLAARKISPDQLQATLAPTSYLGATAQFIHRALEAHKLVESLLSASATTS